MHKQLDRCTSNPIVGENTATVFNVMVIKVSSVLFQVPNGDVVIGSGVPLNTLISVLDDLAKVMSGYKVLADHVHKVKVDQI